MIHRHKKERGFVTLDKTALNDHGLSWAAKGLHSYLMGLPDDWRVNLVDLSQRSKSAKAATTTAMDELIAAGYVFRQKVIAAGNRFAGYQYQMFETPTDAERWKSANGISVVGKPDYGKPEHGESEYGKSVTNKGLRNQGIEIVNTDGLSNEGDAPAHFADVRMKVSKGQPVLDFVPDSLLEEEITGADAPKRKPSKKATATGHIADSLTEDQFCELWQQGDYARENPQYDPALIYNAIYCWCDKDKKNTGSDWMRRARQFVLNSHTYGRPGEFVRKAPGSVAAQVKMAQAAGYQPTQREIAAAQWEEMQERNAAKGGPRP